MSIRRAEMREKRSLEKEVSGNLYRPMFFHRFQKKSCEKEIISSASILKRYRPTKLPDLFHRP